MKLFAVFPYKIVIYVISCVEFVSNAVLHDAFLFFYLPCFFVDSSDIRLIKLHHQRTFGRANLGFVCSDIVCECFGFDWKCVPQMVGIVWP